MSILSLFTPFISSPRKFIFCSLALSSFYVSASDCTKKEAQKAVDFCCEQFNTQDPMAATKAVVKYRYCGSNYIWTQTAKDGKVFIKNHPIKPRLNGKDVTDFKDKKGKAIFSEFDKKARAGGGEVQYVWPKPGAEVPTDKVSFVKLCKGDVVCGSGVWTK